MTYGAWEVVGQEDQELPLGKSIGDALRDLIRKRWKNNAAKLVQTRWDLDPKTAKNVVSQGHVSERTLTKAAKAERWALWMALGEELFEESYADYLESIVHERELARERAEARRDHLRGLEDRAAKLVSMAGGKGHRPHQ